jgi:hypothetical protein
VTIIGNRTRRRDAGVTRRPTPRRTADVLEPVRDLQFEIHLRACQLQELRLQGGPCKDEADRLVEILDELWQRKRCLVAKLGWRP